MPKYIAVKAPEDTTHVEVRIHRKSLPIARPAVPILNGKREFLSKVLEVLGCDSTDIRIILNNRIVLTNLDEPEENRCIANVGPDCDVCFRDKQYCAHYKTKGRLDEPEEEHEAGCPAIYDDESDQVLADFQECTCTNKPEEDEQKEQEDVFFETRSIPGMGCNIIARRVKRCPRKDGK